MVQGVWGVWSLWEMFVMFVVGAILTYIPTVVAYMKDKAKAKDDKKGTMRKATLKAFQKVETEK